MVVAADKTMVSQFSLKKSRIPFTSLKYELWDRSCGMIGIIQIQNLADTGNDTGRCNFPGFDFVEVAPVEILSGVLCNLFNEPRVRPVNFHKANLDILSKLTKRLLSPHIFTLFY